MLKTKTVEVPDDIYKNEKEDKKLEIYREINPLDPRKSEHLGKMLCCHRDYNLGDEQIDESKFSGLEEVEQHLREDRNAEVVLPLYLYDHSGLRMKVGSFKGKLPQGHARFDTSKVGFIYATQDKIEEYKLEDEDKEKIKEYLKKEVESYDSFLSGLVWRYKYFEDGEIKDSCGNFIGGKSEITTRITEILNIDNIGDWNHESNC